MRDWTLDDIPWAAFDPAKVDPELLRAVKAAALVEGNADDYVRYLKNIFADDADFCALVEQWGVEENQHGAALARWCELADPAFSYADAMARFRAGYRLPLDATASVRGSRSGELIARCVVECGTSSFYSAIRDATGEPALKAVAAKIARDEFRHYRLFEKELRRYQPREPLGVLRRLGVAIGRMQEASDDELAMAYWCANQPPEPYDRKRHSEAYAARVWRLYRFGHVQRGVGMALKACGIDPQGRLSRFLARWGYRFLAWKAARLRMA
jgi:rubrerythrin